MRVPESGGTAVSLDPTAVNPQLGGGRYPYFLVGDSRRFVFQQRGGETWGQVYLASLDGGTPKPFVATDWGAQISQGFLLFLKGTTLMAQPIGPDDTLIGDAVPLRMNVAGGSAAYPAFSTSTTSTLAFANPTRVSELRWFNRAGTALNAVAPAGDYIDFRLSPDETRVAYSRVDSRTQAPDVFVKDLRSGADRQVTSDSLSDASPLWSPRGDELTYRSNRGSRANQIYRIILAGAATDRHHPDAERVSDDRANRIVLLEDECSRLHIDRLRITLSPDGTTLLFSQLDSQTHDLVLVENFR